MKISIKSLQTIILLFSTIFYIKFILIKPVYILLLIILFASYIKNRYILNIKYIITSIIFQTFLIYQLIFLDADIGMVLNATLSILSFPVLCFYLKGANTKTILSFLNLSIIFFTIEMLWRLTNPIYFVENRDVLSNDGAWFYPYKLNSFIFQDSNFVALHLFCLLVISLSLNLRFKSLILYILIILTFSRSAILGSILFIFLFAILNSRYFKFLKIFIYFLIIIFIIYFAMIFENLSKGYILDDGSFLSKFSIINLALNYSDKYFLLSDYLFGIGLANSYKLIGIGAHNILVVILFETGIVGTIIYLFYFSSIINKNYIKEKMIHYYLLFMGIFLLMGFSLGLYLFPIMVLTFAYFSTHKYIVRSKKC